MPEEEANASRMLAAARYQCDDPQCSQVFVLPAYLESPPAGPSVLSAVQWHGVLLHAPRMISAGHSLPAPARSILQGSGSADSHCLPFLQAQEALLQAAWASRILQHESCRPVMAPEDGRLLFSGPRVKMGICFGEPTSIQPDAVSGRASYAGFMARRWAAEGMRTCCVLQQAAT